MRKEPREARDKAKGRGETMRTLSPKKQREKALIDEQRAEEIKIQDERLKAHDFICFLYVPIKFEKYYIRPNIGRTEGVAWDWILSYWDSEKQEAWVKIGLYKPEVKP
jgi:hypothetical protein